MYLLVNVLEQTEHLPHILEAFAKIGIKGATVLNSTGMGRVLMQTKASSQLSEHINKVIADLESSNKTILTVIKDKNVLDQAINIIKCFCGDLREPGKGILFVMPVEIAKGLSEAQ